MVIQKEYMIPSMLYDIHYWDKDSCFWLFITFWLLYSSINHLPAFFISSLCNRLLNSRHAAVQSSRYRGGEQPDLFCNLLYYCISINLLYYFTTAVFQLVDRQNLTAGCRPRRRRPRPRARPSSFGIGQLGCGGSTRA